MPVIYEDGNYLTEQGRALIAKSLASQTKIEFTRATIGSGTIPEGIAPKEMTDLVHYEADGVISEVNSPAAGEAQLVFQVFSKDVSQGFLATEAAIWANDPDKGEILYTYIVIASNPEWIRASSDPVQKYAEFTCISIVGAPEVDMTVVNPEAIATLGIVNKRLSAFVELSENETPKEDTRVHLFVVEKIINWFKANKADNSESAQLLFDNGQSADGAAQLDDGNIVPLRIIPENNGK